MEPILINNDYNSFQLTPTVWDSPGTYKLLKLLKVLSQQLISNSKQEKNT